MQNIDQLNDRLDNMDMALVKCAAEALAAHRAALVSDDAMELARSSGRLCATVENLLDVIEHVTRPQPAIEIPDLTPPGESCPACRHPRQMHYRDGSEQGGGCDAYADGDAPARCRCKGFVSRPVATTGTGWPV